MRAMRRAMRDESGWTMTLALVIILLVSVMGAGLLTFVSRDMEAVLEVNQGQRAFEMTDAGVEAARQQLGAVPATTSYDGSGTDDIQWSVTKTNTGDANCPSGTTHGVCLWNLDGSNTTTDRVNVTIQHRSATNDFKVVSTGEYGYARRKVEAILVQTAGTGGTPAFYTKSDIKIKKRVTINGVSLFSEKNILLEDLKPSMNAASFKATYEGSPSEDILVINNTTKDPLGDWNKPPWNTAGRTGFTGYASPYNSTSVAFDGVGLAAVGRICGSSSCTSDTQSVADGVYGYDRTTGTMGNNLRFVDKIPANRVPNDPGTITFPFERTVPDVVRLKQAAQAFPGGSKYYAGSSPPWTTLFDAASKDDAKVVFIDAQGSGVSFKDVPEADAYGVLVVWCGKLTQEIPFKGIIITMHGSELPDGTTCGQDKGGFVNKGQRLTGYAYTEGDVGGTQGIELEENSVLNPLTGPGRDALIGVAFGTGSTSSSSSGSIKIQAWRELYQ